MGAIRQNCPILPAKDILLERFQPSLRRKGRTDRQTVRRTRQRSYGQTDIEPIDRRTLNGKIDSSSHADQGYIYFMGSFTALQTSK